MKTTRLVSAPPAAPTHILVVDDEPPIREFAARVLENAGYQVTTAGDAFEAIASVEEHGAPALLLSDLKMPRMDGDALAARLRRSMPDLKVLYLTGYPQTLFDNRGVLWEGEAFLEKPCSPPELRRRSRLYSSIIWRPWAGSGLRRQPPDPCSRGWPRIPAKTLCDADGPHRLMLP